MGLYGNKLIKCMNESNYNDKFQNFLLKVEKLAKKSGIDEFFVVAGNHSITRNRSNEGIKACRDALKEFERKIGSDPNEDWQH